MLYWEQYYKIIILVQENEPIYLFECLGLVDQSILADVAAKKYDKNI